MELDVITLALLTAACWGISSPLSKLGMERGGTPLQASLTVVGVSVFAYWSIILFQGRQLLENSLWIIAFFAITGFFATAVARLLTYTGVRQVGASVNSAVTNTRPIWSMMLAVILLGEQMTVQTSLGAVSVVVGLIVLAFSKGGDISGWKLRDLLFPLAAALMFAGGNVARRFGLTATDITSLEAVALNETAGLVGLVGYFVYRHRDSLQQSIQAPRAAYGYFLGTGVLSAIALFSLFEAFNRGRVVVVDPLSSPTSLFSILFTAIFLKDVEDVNWRVGLGAVFVISGVVLITGPQLL